jgi:N-acetylmuramoyl-L-alanine amidase
VIDASHGGDDRGETLSPTLFEKDVTVALARSLRQELESRGITVLDLRDSDATLSLDQRAYVTNTNRVAIYIALHATASGHGVRVYTALLPYGGDDRGPFHSWNTAQHAFLTAQPERRRGHRQRIPETPDSRPRPHRAAAPAE